jgi:hypothetical protein
MKGPGYKLSHDVRRTWRCPACGVERKLVGTVTSLVCHCRPEGTFMSIVVERTVAPRPFQVPQEHDVRSSEFGIDDMPVLQPHPSSLPPERTGPRRPRPEGRGSEPTVRPADQSEPPPAVLPTPIVDVVPPPPPSLPLPLPLNPKSEAKPEPEVSPPALDEPEDDWGAGILEAE